VEGDATPPETLITEAPPATSTSASATFSFWASEPATFECSLNGAAFTPCDATVTYTDLPAGDNFFYVRAKDTAGNYDPVPAIYEWLVEDTTPPDTQLIDQPVDPSGPDNVSFSFTGTDNPVVGGEPVTLEFQCRLDSQSDAAWSACSSPQTYSNLSAGSHTFEVRAVDEAGNADPTPASHTWTVELALDTTPPQTTIGSGPSVTTTATSASFAFSSEPGATFECSLDGAAYTLCTSPAEYTGLAVGPHEFQVRAKDAAGNVDPTPASYTWTVQAPPDTTAPDTTIETQVAAETEGNQASFSFQSSEPGSTFECALDGQSFSSCTSPAQYTDLAPGRHNFQVRAKDAAGNVDQTPASFTWTILDPPDTTIDTAPEAQTEDTSASFTFSANRDGAPVDGATFECALDGAGFTPCDSGVTYTGLAPGSHDFEVQAVSAGGSVDESPASYSWEIGDLTPPVVTIHTGPAATTEDTNPTFTFSVDDEEAVLLCSLDGATPTLCTSPKSYTEADLRGQDGDAAGAHTFEVTADKQHLLVDAVPTEWAWEVVDNTPPTTTIVSRPDPEILIGTPAVFTFSSNEPAASFDCSMDGEAFSSCAGPPTNRAEFSGLTAGSHTLRVQAVDPSENIAASPESYTFEVVGPPTTTITGPDNPTTGTSATFTFSADRDGSTFQCSLDGAPFATCTSPVTHTGLAEGDHSFEVRATNDLGLIEEPPASHDWTIEPPADTTAPETTINAGPPASTSSTTATISFSANELDATFQCSLDGAPFADCFSPEELTGLAVGSYTFKVQATDAAGNVDVTPAERTWTITEPVPPNTPTGSNVTVTLGTTSLTFAEVTIAGTTTVDAQATAPALPDGYVQTGALYYDVNTTAAFSAPVTACFAYDPMSLDEPVRLLHYDGAAWTDVTISADPALGRVCGEVDSFSLFAVATGTASVVPETTIHSSPPATTVSATATFEFLSNDPAATFECSLDSEPASWGSCEERHVIEDVLAGSHELLVRAKNAAGTVDATPARHEWTVEPPDTTIDAGPAARTKNVDASFTFSSNDPVATFECNLDNERTLDGALDWGSCESPYVLTGLAVGQHELLVRAVNSANTDTNPASHSWTIEPLPDTTIVTAPADPTDNRDATFTFTSDQQNVTFECALDDAVSSGIYSPCESGVTYPGLVFGEHDFAVRARDAEGNVDPTPADWSWEIGTVPPPTTITAGPDARTESKTATFEFTAGRGFAYECRLDSAPFSPCTSPKTYNGVPMGVHVFQVRVFDPEAAAEPEIATYTWEVADLTAPETTIEFGPPAETLSRTANFAFGSNDPSATFECSLDGAAFTACPEPAQYTNLPNGPHTLRVRAVDLAGNFDTTPAERTWTVTADTTPPETTIQSKPAASSPATEAIFSFSSSEGGSTFECSLDGEPFAECSAPAEYTDLTVGQHTFRVRAIDIELNVDPTPAEYTWTVEPDTTAPDTFIDSGPPASTPDNFASFDLRASEPDATFECSLDGEAFEECFDPAQFIELLPGQHTLEVRAVDLSLNVDPTPATYTWLVEGDPNGPNTTIQSGPPATTTNLIATFTFFSNIADADFECQLDGGLWESCSSPEEYSELTAGKHTLLVRAIDQAGNVEAEPASYTWTIIGPPETTIDSGPEGEVTSASATFTFSASESDATFECRIDFGTFSACTSPKTYNNLFDGDHAFEVRAIGANGMRDETPAILEWTTAVPPTTTINFGPSSPTNGTTANFGFTANEFSATFECSLDGGAFTECLSPHQVTGLTPGQHTFAVQAVDIDGNVDPTPATYTWTVDTAAPDTTIVSVTSGSIVFDFSASEPGSSFECSLDGAAFEACSSPQRYTDVGEGSHNFKVRAIDQAGNVDPTPASHDWTVDTTAPDTTIGSKPATSTSSTSASFGFSGSEQGSTFECSLDGAAFAACSSPKDYTGLAAGSHEFRVRATDTYGNVDSSPASYSWTVDAAAPQTTITSGSPSETTVSTSASFSFSASEQGSTFECSLDGAAFAGCSSPKEYTGLASGAHQFRVRAIDPAGNVDGSPAAYNWTVDATAPETTIDSKPAASTSSTSASFGFSADEQGSTFDCSLDGAAFAACSSPKEYTALTVGAHEFRVRATDALGNVEASPASYSWTVEPPPSCGTQATASANADSWIDRGSPSQNKGTDSILKVMSKGPSHDVRSLVRFNMPSIPAGCAVKSATLRLYSGSWKDGRTLQALRVTGSWTEGGVTWDNQPATAGTPATAASGSGYREWDVKSQVKAMYDTSAPHGFLIRDAAEGQDSEQQFNSREKGDNVPQLVVTFGAPDTTAPNTTIDSGPGTSTTSTSAQFTFSADEQDATFECSLDGAAFTDCSSPKDYTGLALGNHELRVRAKDWVGNADGSPATYNWKIEPDTTAPETTLGSEAPPATTTSTTARFSFSSNDQGATFECSIDGFAFIACSSPKEYTSLTVGSHSFRVRAKDAAGNVDSTPASHVWTIEASSCASTKTASADRDTWVLQSSPTSNFGNDSVLKVDSKSTGNARALIRFALPTIPAGCSVTSATLRLYSGSYKEGRTLQAIRLSSTFMESGVNWGNQPTTSGAFANAPSRSSAGYVEWSVTGQVRNLYSLNTGFLIRDASENGGGMEQSFNSREKGTDNPPQLVITFG
jgi:hypothetical protein